MLVTRCELRTLKCGKKNFLLLQNNWLKWFKKTRKYCLNFSVETEVKLGEQSEKQKKRKIEEDQQLTKKPKNV